MSISIKIFGCDGTDSVRRRKFDMTSLTLTQVEEVANLPNNARLTWKDEDGDIVTIFTQAELQEAVASAVAQKSSLRLYVDHSKLPRAPTESEPAPAQESRDIKKSMKSISQCARENFFSTLNSVRSACESSNVFQALKEDSRSVRAIFEARVERNLSDAPIQKIASCFVHAVLLWALFCPSFFLLLKIAIAAAFMPRNALSKKDHKRIRLLLGVIGVRVAVMLIMGFTAFVLPPCLFFGVAFCFMPKFLLGLAIFRCLCKKGSCWDDRHRFRERHSNHRTECRDQYLASKQQNLTSRQREDIATITKIFPTMHFEHLRKTYMVHKDVQATVLDILRRTGKGAR